MTGFSASTFRDPAYISYIPSTLVTATAWMTLAELGFVTVALIVCAERITQHQDF